MSERYMSLLYNHEQHKLHVNSTDLTLKCFTNGIDSQLPLPPTPRASFGSGESSKSQSLHVNNETVAPVSTMNADFDIGSPRQQKFCDADGPIIWDLEKNIENNRHILI